MSEEPRAPRRPPEPVEGGGGWKWLAIAGVAAVVLGGGYYAWQAMSPAEPAPSEIAYDDPAPAPESFEPLAAGELDLAAAPEIADEPAPKAAAPRPRPRPAPAPEPIPEQVIGVGPIDLTNPIDDDSANEIIVTAPRWVRQPTARRLSAAYPARALERGREGEARVSCMVVQGGALDCEPLSETPGNAGFGRAALRVARMYRHAQVRADGTSAIGTPVNLRVLFRIADDRPRRR